MKIAILILILLFGAALAAAAIHPKTRPYVTRFWWLGVLFGAFLLGLLVAAPRKRRGLPEDPTGHLEGPPDLGALNGVVVRAMEGKLQADLELERRRLVAEATTEASRERLSRFETDVEEIRWEPDHERRRARLVQVVREAQRWK